MKSRLVAFLVGLAVFALVFLALDYFVMDMQGLSLMFEHGE